jgi:tetratricopeptide (TPR) repeat protein
LVIRDLTPPEVAAKFEEIAVRSCSLTVKDIDLWSYEAPVIRFSHGLAAANLALERKMSSSDAGRLLAKIGARLLSIGQIDEARRMFERSLEILTGRFGSSHPELVQSLLGQALIAEGEDLKAAVKIYQRILEIADSKSQIKSRAIAQNNLAEVYRKLKQPAESERLLKESLMARTNLFGPDHPAVSNSLNNLGNLYGSMGLYPLAHSYYEKSYAIRRKKLNSPHPLIANSLNNLGWIYLRLNLPKKAERPLREALRIWEALYGPNHREVAITLRNLSNLYKRTRGKRKADEYAERAHAIETIIKQSVDPVH